MERTRSVLSTFDGKGTRVPITMSLFVLPCCPCTAGPKPARDARKRMETKVRRICPDFIISASPIDPGRSNKRTKKLIPAKGAPSEENPYQEELSGEPYPKPGFKK